MAIANPSFIHIPGPGETVHVYHANGFPAGVYQLFLNALSQHFNVYAMDGRAIWAAEQPNHRDWQIYADDLIAFLDAQQIGPVIGIGHSMGASSTVLAALKRPDLFKSLVLIEPAMVDWPLRLMMKLLPKRIIRDSKLVKGTLNKPDRWPDEASYLTYIKKFSGYKLFSEETFQAFSRHAIKPTGDGHTLVFSNHWESHNYTHPPYLLGCLKQLDNLNIPTVAISGRANKFFGQVLWQKWQAKQPSAVFIKNEKYGHLIPLEAPQECVNMLMVALAQLTHK